MNFKYRNIIWDWNGTLFDDVEYCVSIINEILTRRSLKNLTVDEYKRVFTFPVEDYYRKLGLLDNGETFEDLSVEFIDKYEKNKFNCGLYSFSEDVLSFLHQNKLNQVILSAYKQDTLEEIIKFFKLDKYFSGLFGMGDIYAKSKIKLGEYLIEKMNFDNDNTLFIGDTYHDFEVARHLSIDFVMVTYGHQQPDKNRDKSLIYLNSLLEIKNFVRKNESH